MKHNDLLKIIKECSSSGSTGSASIASVSGTVGKTIKRYPEGEGPIGVGFDPDGDWGIYQKPKKNKKK